MGDPRRHGFGDPPKDPTAPTTPFPEGGRNHGKKGEFVVSDPSPNTKNSTFINELFGKASLPPENDINDIDRRLPLVGQRRGASRCSFLRK
ncbi:hypothetical protein HPP92_007201 [Vanilla planifolia]|uniref:Uncharacterized protein n=1 Tax=Vanilla planifolia TaxID=51239 RepID=A0A835RA07_VANPL|nr:hypothetical protein HPP92_007201 [Vanilla planifolia]